jgi:ABC-type transport system involved in multi-copper enzyme maturation permease subunit
MEERVPMRREIIRALLWKEWRESRWKWLAFYLAFHIPAILGVLAFTFDQAFRFDILVLSNAMTRQYLNLFLVVQSGFAITAGLFLIAFYAASAVAPEIEGRQMFFLFEQPVPRWVILLTKFLLGAGQNMALVGLSILSTLSLGYIGLVIVASGVTLGGSWPEFVRVFASGCRGTLWTGVIGLMVFAGTFIFSVYFEKWWVSVIAGAVALIVMFYFMGASIFDWILTNVINQPGGPEKVNLDLYARLELGPLLSMLGFAVLFYLISQFLFQRKEMR